MPITSPRPVPVLPSLAVCATQLEAVPRERFRGNDYATAVDLLGAFHQGRATMPQANYIEGLWTRYCAQTPANRPEDIERGLDAVYRHMTWDGMPVRGREFRESIRNAVLGGAPTPNQWSSFCDLVNEAETWEAETARRDAEALVLENMTTPPTVVRDSSRLFAMFAAASSPNGGRTNGNTAVLRFPDIRVWFSGQENAIIFNRPHVEPARRTRLARLLRDGTIAGPRTGQPVRLTQEQRAFVVRLCENPEEVIAETGRAVGACCMCGRALTDPVSVALGIGPICGARWRVSTQWMQRRLTAAQAEATEIGSTLTSEDIAAALSGRMPGQVPIEGTVTGRMSSGDARPAFGEPGFLRPHNAPDQEDF